MGQHDGQETFYATRDVDLDLVLRQTTGLEAGAGCSWGFAARSHQPAPPASVVGRPLVASSGCSNGNFAARCRLPARAVSARACVACRALSRPLRADPHGVSSFSVVLFLALGLQEVAFCAAVLFVSE